MKNNIKTILFLSTLMIVFGLFNVATADNGEFFLKFSPENPGLNQSVSVSAGSYSFDINRANITWTVDGVKKLSGTGKKDFAFKIGGAGTKTTLFVSIVNDTGMSFERTISFSPADVDILWEANTYTPYAYKGKALASSESQIKVTAMPYFLSNGENVAPSKLIYDWEINYKKKISDSGYGKQSITFIGSKIFEIDNVKVTVSDYNRNTVAQKTVQIESGNPKIVFYKEHPSEGMKYNQALKNEIELSGNQITLVAEPYYFSRNILSFLKFDWIMNRSIKIESEKEKNKVSLEVNQEKPSGSSDISVDIKNNLNILQRDDEAIRISY